jgi:hypothetical protein
MGRPKRAAKGGLIYHVLNRANARMMIFDKDKDFEQAKRCQEPLAYTNQELAYVPSRCWKRFLTP